MLALVTGNSRNRSAMKDRIKMGYDGKFSQHVTHYDELAGNFKGELPYINFMGLIFMEKN